MICLRAGILSRWADSCPPKPSYPLWSSQWFLQNVSENWEERNFLGSTNVLFLLGIASFQAHSLDSDVLSLFCISFLPALDTCGLWQCQCISQLRELKHKVIKYTKLWLQRNILVQAGVFTRREERESRTKRWEGGAVDMQAVPLLVPMCTLMVSIHELLELRGQTVSDVYSGTEPVDASKVYLEKQLLTDKL